MADIQELLVRFKADIKDFNNKVNQVEASLKDVSKDANNLGNNLSGSANLGAKALGNMAVSMGDVRTSVLLAITAVGAFSINVGMQMESATARIASMVGGVENAHYALSALRDAGSETGTSILTLAENFGKMASFVENGSITLEESINLTKGLSSASLALGASSEQVGYVMYGLSQALGSGVVRAEEFNQVIEPLPALLNRIEKENGLVSGSLRQMVNDGKLTSEQFKEYLIPALQSFEEQAKSMADTVGVQSGKVKNSFVAIGEDIYDNINSPLAKSLSLLDEFLQRLTSVKRATTDELDRRIAEMENLYRSTLNEKKGGYNVDQRLLDVGGELDSLKIERANRDRTGDTIDPNTGNLITAETIKLQKQFNSLSLKLNYDKLKAEKNSAKNAYDENNKQLEAALKAGLTTQEKYNQLRKQNLQKYNEELKALEVKKPKAKKTEAEKESERARKKAERDAQHEIEIRQDAIASAREAIAVAQAETDSARKLDYQKRALAEARKLEAVGVAQGTKEYKVLVEGLEEAFKAQQRMQEELSTEAYVRQKNRENEALADYQEVLGMTSLELEKYNIQKELQADLEEKSLVMTKEGFEAYKAQAEAIAEQTQAILDSNKAFEDSFEGGFAQIMAQARENATTDAQIITQAFDSMSSNVANSFIALTTSGKASFRDMAGAIIQDINQIIMRAIIMRAIAGIAGSIAGSASGGGVTESGMGGSIEGSGFTLSNPSSGFGGYRANGGSVYAGKSYVVGERGQELFVPSQNGTIVPSNKIGGGGSNVNINYSIDARGADPQSAMNIKRAMEQTKRETIAEVQASMRNNGSMARTVRRIQ